MTALKNVCLEGSSITVHNVTSAIKQSRCEIQSQARAAGVPQLVVSWQVTSYDRFQRQHVTRRGSEIMCAFSEANHSRSRAKRTLKL